MPRALPAQGPLGKCIRQIREDELGMTTTAFAKYLKVSQTQVSNWELGQNAPGQKTARFLAENHGLPLDLWFDFVPPEESDARSPTTWFGYAPLPQAAA